MCGIAGTFLPNGNLSQDEIDRVTDALAHRGPDGRGVWLNGEIALGHRRLAILDLTEAGACPMHYNAPDGRHFVITYNGEVYNFIELRAELKERGHKFKSDSDTEVIVAAYSEWGKECLNRFNGMFAFAIWDVNKRQLFMARDRFGIKPLYFHIDQKLSFASEIKALLELDNFNPQLNQTTSELMLENAICYEGETDETLIKNVRRMMPGTYLTMAVDGACKVERWWNTVDHLVDIPQTYEQQVERFRELFFDSLKLRMRSDVDIACCLSGGVDSSAVTSSLAMLRKNHLQQLQRCPENSQHAFIATFPGTALDESKYANMVVADTDVNAHYWEFDSDDALKNLFNSIWSMEEVYGGIAVPVWCTYREVRKAGLTVTLDGHGADELLCGYPWSLDWPMGSVNNNLYVDFHVKILPAILRNFDRCSMAHGVEIRTPFLDYRLVSYLFSLGAEAKVGAGYTKRILRDAMSGIVNDTVRTRRQKIGFNSPMIEWYNGGMAPLLKKVTSHPLWLESKYFNGPELQRLVNVKCMNKAWTLDDWDLSLKIWTYVNFVLWQLMFIEKDLNSLNDLNGQELSLKHYHSSLA